jgi:hypothetical protein
MVKASGYCELIAIDAHTYMRAINLKCCEDGKVAKNRENWHAYLRAKHARCRAQLRWKWAVFRMIIMNRGNFSPVKPSYRDLVGPLKIGDKVQIRKEGTHYGT